VTNLIVGSYAAKKHVDSCGLGRYGVERLYCGLSPELAEGAVVVILDAFADDSQNDDHYIVAGFVAPMARWGRFDSEWFSVLETSPRLGFYRASDADNLGVPGTQFEHFAQAQRDQRIAALARVIPTGTCCFGFRCTISKADFHELYSPTFHPVWKDPYYLCAHLIVGRICFDLAAVPGIKTVDFIFDEHGKVGRRFEGMYDRLIKHVLLPLFPFMGKVRHESKKDFLPLQAADMQAGWIKRLTSSIQIPMSTDVYLTQMVQRDYSPDRSKLEYIAHYAKTHAEEMKAFAEWFEQEEEEK
jgi:hypothetical protein